MRRSGTPDRDGSGEGIHSDHSPASLPQCARCRLPHDHSHHMQEYSWHMRGMWVAVGLAACFIVYFIQRVLRELRLLEEQLATSRERATRSEAGSEHASLGW